MISNKLDFKLINMAIIALIVALLYMTSDFWFGIISIALTIITPFILAFALAHALYPTLHSMVKKGIPKIIGVGILSFVMFGLFILVIWLVIPLSLEQISGLYSGINKFIHDISIYYNLNLGSLQQGISDTFNPIMNNMSKYISNGTWIIVNQSVRVLATIIIIMFVAIYFLIDMEAIRIKSSEYLKLTNEKIYNYFVMIDNEMHLYFVGLGRVLLWQLFEYTFVFYIIGHPNYLLLGILASITTVIPYVGALMTNILALITAFVISPKLFFLTLIAIGILSAIDGYIVSPKIFGTTNKIPPLITIFAVFAGGILGGLIGVIVSLPITIIIISTIKYFKKDIFLKLIK